MLCLDRKCCLKTVRLERLSKPQKMRPILGKYAGMASKRISCKEVRLNSKNIDPVFTKEKESEKQKGKQKAVGSQ